MGPPGDWGIPEPPEHNIVVIVIRAGGRQPEKDQSLALEYSWHFSVPLLALPWAHCAKRSDWILG